MVGKPTYEELEQRVKELEDEALERKGAEDALQASEENSRALSEAAFEAIFLSEKGICLGQNLAAEKMFGYTPSEAIGMTGTDWIAPDSREMVRNNMLSGYEKPYEAIALRKDGSTFPTEIQGKMICYQGREIRVTSLRDITDRVLAEEALRESEEKYRTLLDSIDEVYFEVDIAGNLTFFNDSLSKSLGYSDDELMGMNNRDYMSPESAKKIYNLFNQIYKTGTPRKKAVYEIIRKDGSRGFHELFASLMKDQAGQPIGFRGIAHDITEFKQAEQALRDSEEKFRLIAENSIDAIWQTDLNNKVTYISPSSINIGGYTPEEIMRFENALELYDDELRTLVMTEMSKLLQKPVEELKRYVIPRIQGRALHKDGHKIWVEIQAKFIFKRNMIVGVQGISRDISERKEAETALLKSEKRYRTLVDNLPIAVYRNSPGPKGEFLMANPAFCKMFGFKNEEEVKNFTPASFYQNPKERKKYSDNLIQKGVIKHDERTLLKRDGTPVHTSITSRVVYGKDGEVSHFDSIMLDITEQKLSEEALRESEDKYRNLVEESFDGIFIQKGPNIIFVNKRLNEMLGYEEGELIGQNHWVVYHPDYQKVTRERAQARMHGEEVVRRYEVKLQRKDGSWFYGEINARPIIFSSDKESGIQVWIKDIMEQKLAEESLRESEEKYRLLIENATDAIFIAQDEVLKFANPKTEEMTGYSAEELAEIPFLDLIHPEDRDMVLQRHLKRLKDEELPSLYSFRILNRSGEELSVEINTVLINWEGRPATLNFLRDITAQKKLEAQLQQAQKMESIGTLAGGIAHDFNNLLMAMQGRASIMLMNKDSSHPDFEHLRGIEGHVESAADLTKQLLGFARGGKYEVRPTDLNELIKKQNRMFGRTKKEIIINGKYEENLWSAEIDRGQIEQVLLNLYVNAWQAMPGGGSLYVETENVTLDENYIKPFAIEPGRYVKISVTDTGVGMDKATQERIFDPFFTTKEMGRGTGLGLASSYGIIKNHGGFINVYSEKGHGTTFNVYLPASEKEVIEEKKLAGDTVRGTETVLLVDDEDMIIEIAEELLAQLGYKVLTAKSGKEAIEIYEENKEEINIVLLDMIMPDMSGGETYDRLKDINPKAKILLSSGYSINGQATEILDRGCNGFIQKPFKIKELSQKLREILEEK